MENEFILHFKSSHINEQDALIKDLLLKGKIDVSLDWEQISESGDEAFYRIKISPSSLIQLKHKLDVQVDYESLELFEYRSW